MAQLHFSDEILMAFADGELDEEIAATVEQAMAQDPAVARRVAEFLRSRRLIRSAFPEETASDVPPDLRAAVLAQIERFEGQRANQPSPGPTPSRIMPVSGRLHYGMAMAASLAAIAVAAAGYLVGQQGLRPSPPGPIAHLGTPEVNHVLSESPSGQERELSFGRMRVISTFRVANGSLCREFKLQTSSGTSEAVACHDHDWIVTIALASPAASASYVPSGGTDLMANYIEQSGAGEPLVNGAEIQALEDIRRQR